MDSKTLMSGLESSRNCRRPKKGVRERTDIPRFYQVHLGGQNYGNAETDTRVLPFATFCRELALP
jgi:hypothetical protein